MVQMGAADQLIIKSIPGNDKCMECGMKGPQWASVSFGTVFCLDCSGVHRSLGVHISFVRSIAMDSWTDTQLALMKTGGNAKCAAYIKSHGVDLKAPIKQKYEHPAAQLYKEVLKARAEGRPEPTELPQRAAPASGGMSAVVGKPGEDPNGMERMTGETEQQYVARQTRLRNEARARMAAKFGNSGGMVGGVGSNGGSRMGGIGSDSSYDPNRGGYGGDLNVDSIVSGFGTALSSLGSIASSATQAASSVITDPGTQATLQGLSGSVRSSGSSLWGSLSATVNSLTEAIAQPDDGGLSDFQREVNARRSATGSKYAGFGSDTAANGSGFDFGGASGSSFGASSSTLEEAPGLRGEDRNGIERLSGESDEQYIMRQTRLRDEAKARMAAKFGGGGMSSASSNPYSGGSSVPVSRVPSAPSSNGSANMAASMSAPTSGNLTPPRTSRPTPTKLSASKVKVESSDDFFANFGT